MVLGEDFDLPVAALGGVGGVEQQIEQHLLNLIVVGEDQP